MTTRRRPVSILLFGVCFLGAWLYASRFIFRPAEPTFQGKTISEWVLLYDNHVDNQAEQNAAQHAFLNLKEKALPTVVEILRKRENSKAVQAIRSLALRLHLISPPRFPLYEWHLRAGRTAAFLGFNAGVDVDATVPHLAYHLTNTTSFQSEFAYDLAHAGWSGIAVLTNALRHSSAQVREEAALKLLLYPKDVTPEIINLVLGATRDPNAAVRGGALLSLKHLQHFRNSVIPTNALVAAAVQSCKDADSQVRKWAVDLLGGYLTVADVDKTVRAMLEDSDLGVRTQAAEVLRR